MDPWATSRCRSGRNYFKLIFWMWREGSSAVQKEAGGPWIIKPTDDPIQTKG